MDRRGLALQRLLAAEREDEHRPMRVALVASIAALGAALVTLIRFSSPSGHWIGRECFAYRQHVHVMGRVIWGS